MWGEGLAQLLELLLPAAGGVRGGRRGPRQPPGGGVQLLLPLARLPQQALQLGELGGHRVLCVTPTGVRLTASGSPPIAGCRP
ncbi:hypothetical protein, partial [Xylella fastidiosa]